MITHNWLARLHWPPAVLGLDHGRGSPELGSGRTRCHAAVAGNANAMPCHAMLCHAARGTAAEHRSGVLSEHDMAAATRQRTSVSGPLERSAAPLKMQRLHGPAAGDQPVTNGRLQDWGLAGAVLRKQRVERAGGIGVGRVGV